MNFGPSIWLTKRKLNTSQLGRRIATYTAIYLRWISMRMMQGMNEGLLTLSYRVLSKAANTTATNDRLHSNRDQEEGMSTLAEGFGATSRQCLNASSLHDGLYRTLVRREEQQMTPLAAHSAWFPSVLSRDLQI